MRGLSRELIEHHLPIKPRFRPHKQHLHRFNSTIYDRVKEEINRLLEAGFIRPCRYAEWVSNIVPLRRKILESYGFALILEILIEPLQ
jgi:hypothetical protein